MAIVAGGVLFAFAVTPRAYADVNDIADIFLIKAQSNRQTSPANPVPKTNPFTFIVGANPRATNSILSAAFQKPGGTLQSMNGDGQGNFFFDGGGFATLANLNTTFPNGTYNFSFQTVTPPTSYNTSVPFTGDNYPGTVPKILNPDWASGGFQVDSTQDFTFNCNSFSPFATNGDSVVGLQIFDAANNLVFNVSATTPVTLFTLQANTLQADQYYNAVLGFGNRTTTVLGAATTAITNYQVTTEFKIATISGIPVLISPRSILATAGQPLVYQIVATNHPFNYTADGLDPGLNLDPATGIISGIPRNSGTNVVSLSAENQAGDGFDSVAPTIQPTPAPGPVMTSSTCALSYTGQPFAFKVATKGATSAARVSATGLPSGLMIDPVTGLISGVTNSAGSFLVNLTVNDGNSRATGSLQLTFTDDAGYPVITNANMVTVPRGQPFNYTIATGAFDPADPPTFSMFGTLPQGLSFNAATGTISGTYIGPFPESASGGLREPEIAGGALLGSIQLFSTNSHGTSTFQLLFRMRPSRVINISTRLLVRTGENVLIGGFIVTGNAPKIVLLRAIGPSLSAFGVTGALQDPILELHNGSTVLVNDNWRTGNPNQEQVIIDTGIPPTDDRESAILIGLDPGPYTAIVAGTNGTSGIALVEAYDLGTASLDTDITAQLAEISTRGFVDVGDNAMIGGFIVQDVAITTLVRAIGPSLSAVGIGNALQDTTLELHNGNGAIIASNDDWRSDQEQAIIATGVPPPDNRESAIVANLVPDGYTAIVRGKGNTTGVALVEVYALP